LRRVKKELVEKFLTSDKSIAYNWEIPNNCPILFPKELISDYEKNLFLKYNLFEKFESDDFLDISYWIIQIWGGIKSFKRNVSNDEKLNTFVKTIKENNAKLKKSEFDIISSLSKIAAFLLPERFCVYDSRVIYSLNWHIFLYGDSLEMFPQPSGRNKTMIEYDQRTIFNLSAKPYSFYSTNDAYQKYCDFLKEIEVEYKINIQEMEMYLFSIADSDIIKDIKGKIRLIKVST